MATIDVVAVSTETNKVLWVYPTTDRNADNVIAMAVVRQGVDDRFFTEAPVGTYKEGDEYKRVED